MVPDPVLGLRALLRVLVADGQLLLLEHVLSHHPLLGPILELLNPLVVCMMGANINRETVEHVRRAGFIGLQARIAGWTSSSRSRRRPLGWPPSNARQ